MAIRIECLSVEKIGPLSGCDLELGPFNLVYGHNEMGKTLLVEFVIRSLFRNCSGWGLRSVDSRGQVWVSGLPGEGSVAFTPASRNKLEDHWVEKLSGLPPRVSRLLVVKGADVGLTDNPGIAVSKTVLKELLSGYSVIDRIRGSIQPTVQEAKIGDGVIEGYRRGELKNRLATQKKSERLDALFARIDQHYSGGRRAELRTKLDEVEAALGQAELARRHHAWLLADNIRKVEGRLGRLPRQELEDLRLEIRAYVKDEAELRRKQDRLAELSRISEGYRWLEEAAEIYAQREELHALAVHSRWLVIGGIAFALAIFFGLLNVTLGTVLALLIAAAAMGKYIRDLRKVAQHAGAVDEMHQLAAEFEERFHQPLSGLPLLRQMTKELQGQHYETQTLAKEIQDTAPTLADQHVEINDRLRALSGKTLPVEGWPEAMAKLQQIRDQLENEQRHLEDELRQLNVAPSDYREQPAEIVFSQEALDGLHSQKKQFEDELATELKALDELKQAICQETDDEITIGWELLLQHLQEERAENAKAYRRQTSSILAQILVCEVLDELRVEEDGKIQRHLRSPLIAGPLRSITSRYESVSLDGEQVYVADSFGQFSLSDLSTGAQEQVLLALRLGMAATILQDQALFLILDDAFQYSDWQRRNCLLEQMVALAQAGWQITYFTMDDHIRDLFDTAGHACFGNAYRHIDLDTVSA